MIPPLNKLISIADLASSSDRKEAIVKWISAHVRTYVSDASVWKNIRYESRMEDIRTTGIDATVDSLMSKIRPDIEIRESEFPDAFHFRSEIVTLV
jgi:hypothetical protein